jgi:hypothetical protein
LFFGVLYSAAVAQDKRETERVAILGELYGEMMVFQPMQIREISNSGVTVETRYPLQLNSLHELRLTLGHQSVVVKGRVVHSEISDVDQEIVTYRSGLELVEASEHAAAAISGFLETVKTSRSAT